MAQSIFVTLDTLEVETSVPKIEDKDGNVIRKNFGNVKHTLPRNNYPTGEQFEDAEMLETWARENGVLHQCLQSGITSWVIDDRATFKSQKKGDTWTPEYGQKNVDTVERKVMTRPTGQKSKEDIAMDFLNSLSPADRKKFITENFG